MQTSILSAVLLCNGFSDPATPNMGAGLRQAQRMFAQNQQGRLTKSVAVGEKGDLTTCKKTKTAKSFQSAKTFLVAPLAGNQNLMTILPFQIENCQVPSGQM